MLPDIPDADQTDLNGERFPLVTSASSDAPGFRMDTHAAPRARAQRRAMTPSAPAPAQRVLIIGLGQIGMGYDLSLDPAQHILTHARAFARNPAFVVVGGADPSPEARAKFAHHYGAPAYADVATAVHETQPNLVVVATPTAQHLETVLAVFAAGRPRVLVCEKPLAHTVADGRAITEACAQNDCRLYVNYMRRSDPTAAALRAHLADGRIATPLK
eukprot:gene1888-2467_t